MTIENYQDENDNEKSKKNRRTLSESDVRFDENLKTLSPICEERLISSPIQVQKRSHSLPHRYKSRNNQTSTTSPLLLRSRPLIYSPDEFRRGIQAMQSWFRNLDDNQRTLALQNITVITFSSEHNFYEFIFQPWLCDKKEDFQMNLLCQDIINHMNESPFGLDVGYFDFRFSIVAE